LGLLRSKIIQTWLYFLTYKVLLLCLWLNRPLSLPMSPGTPIQWVTIIWLVRTTTEQLDVPSHIYPIFDSSIHVESFWFFIIQLSLFRKSNPLIECVITSSGCKFRKRSRVAGSAIITAAGIGPYSQEKENAEHSNDLHC